VTLLWLRPPLTPSQLCDICAAQRLRQSDHWAPTVAPLGACPPAGMARWLGIGTTCASPTLDSACVRVSASAATHRYSQTQLTDNPVYGAIAVTLSPRNTSSGAGRLGGTGNRGAPVGVGVAVVAVVGGLANLRGRCRRRRCVRGIAGRFDGPGAAQKHRPAGARRGIPAPRCTHKPWPERTPRSACRASRGICLGHQHRRRDRSVLVRRRLTLAVDGTRVCLTKPCISYKSVGRPCRRNRMKTSFPC
jgi:hypothetical protein